MDVRINGEVRDIPAGLTVLDLLRHLQLSTERVAVEHNRALLKRERWAEVPVVEGDELEIVQFVGGG